MYLSLIRKVVSHGPAFVTTERARLRRLLSSSNHVNSRQRDRFQRRLNALHAFGPDAELEHEPAMAAAAAAAATGVDDAHGGEL